MSLKIELPFVSGTKSPNPIVAIVDVTK